MILIVCSDESEISGSVISPLLLIGSFEKVLYSEASGTTKIKGTFKSSIVLTELGKLECRVVIAISISWLANRFSAVSDAINSVMLNLRFG